MVYFVYDILSVLKISNVSVAIKAHGVNSIVYKIGLVCQVHWQEVILIWELYNKKSATYIISSIKKLYF